MYKLLKNGFVEDGVLRLEEGSSFPVAKSSESGMNVVLIRSTVLDLLDIFIYVAEDNRIGGLLKHAGVLITGPPGDGKVLIIEFVIS
jgi:hypothetical protein